MRRRGLFALAAVAILSPFGRRRASAAKAPDGSYIDAVRGIADSFLTWPRADFVGSLEGGFLSPSQASRIEFSVEHLARSREELERLGDRAFGYGSGDSTARAACRTSASAPGPCSSADTGMSSSANLNRSSAIAGVSDPDTRSAPISTPHSDANAAICCCSRVQSDIYFSMGPSRIPMVNGLDQPGNGTVEAAPVPGVLPPRWAPALAPEAGPTAAAGGLVPAGGGDFIPGAA
jgi:hypothetical protein